MESEKLVQKSWECTDGLGVKHFATDPRSFAPGQCATPISNGQITVFEVESSQVPSFATGGPRHEASPFELASSAGASLAIEWAIAFAIGISVSAVVRYAFARKPLARFVAGTIAFLLYWALFALYGFGFRDFGVHPEFVLVAFAAYWLMIRKPTEARRAELPKVQDLDHVQIGNAEEARSTSSVEVELAILKGLREKELISAEVYEARQLELLRRASPL